MNLLNLMSKKKNQKFNSNGYGIIAACAFCAVAGMSGHIANASSVFPMQEFNVIVLGAPNGNGGRTAVGNFDDNSDIQGSTFINGDVDGSTFADQRLPGGDTIGLEATGSVTSSSVHVDNGGVLLGGTAATGFTDNGGGAINSGSSQPATDLVNFSNALTSASNSWAGQTTTSGVSVQTGNNSMNFTIPTSAGNFVVFNVSSSNFRQNDSIEFTGLSSNQQVLINVSGTSFTEPGGINFNGDSTIADNVLWNFSQATSITLTSGFFGSILAPNATLSSGSTITGNLAVANISSVGEIDFASPTFTTPIHATPLGGPLPVPASFGLVAIGSIALLAGCCLRKRVRM